MPLHGIGGLERSVHDLVRHLAAHDVDVTLDRAARGARAGAPRAIRSRRLESRSVHVPYVTFPFANRRGTTVLDRSTAYPLFGWRAGRLARALVRERTDRSSCTDSAPACSGTPRRDATSERRSCSTRRDSRSSGRRQRASLAQGARLRPLRRAVRACSAAADRGHRHRRVAASRRSPASGACRSRDCRRFPTASISVATSALAVVRPMAAPFASSTASAPTRSLLLSVGRLEDNKGFDVLGVRAAARHRERPVRSPRRPWRWVIVGGGPFKADLERAVADHGIGAHALFAGKRRRRGAARVVRSGDVVRPSDTLRGQLARHPRGHGASQGRRGDARGRAARQGQARRERLARGAGPGR